MLCCFHGIITAILRLGSTIADHTQGRSPYEAPDETTTEEEGSTRYMIPAPCGDGYVQHYDERGHPINPKSKVLGRGLRRAKNDILSTMGIVVSGEGGNAIVSKEQQKVNQISVENDYGTILNTLDQTLVFLGTWWTTSLTNRIQAGHVNYYQES